jgi:prolyl-tRNA editing enzyme YbaK/EbsC (Cys-tRNA(Pro) deacylase)
MPKVSSDGLKATIGPPAADTWEMAPLNEMTKEPVGATSALGTALSVQIEHEAVYLKLDYTTPQSADIG